MSHNLGRVVADGRTFNQTTGLDLTPSPGPLGGPRFVILHFDNVNLTGAAKLTVELGYGTDVFTRNSGADFWSRPVDTSTSADPDTHYRRHRQRAAAGIRRGRADCYPGAAQASRAAANPTPTRSCRPTLTRSPSSRLV